MTNGIKNWQDFLDSLATAGGNIVTLFWCSIFSGALWIWVAMRGPDSMVTPMFGVFTGFTASLLQAQKGNSSRQQMADRMETALGGQASDAQKAATGQVVAPPPVILQPTQHGSHFVEITK